MVLGWSVGTDWRRSLGITSISIQTLAAFVASRGIGQYIRQHFLDTTFKGLYHANAFDMALLVPYFVVLILLASYGLHRYVLVYLYYKHRDNRTVDPAGHFSELPLVTVQLPIFNEQFVVERLLDAVCRLQYPLEKLDVQLLDDSTDETQAVRKAWSSSTPLEASRSPTITAAIVKVIRRGRWRKA